MVAREILDLDGTTVFEYPVLAFWNNSLVDYIVLDVIDKDLDDDNVEVKRDLNKLGEDLYRFLVAYMHPTAFQGFVNAMDKGNKKWTHDGIKWRNPNDR
jgi:hypothetical protein